MLINYMADVGLVDPKMAKTLAPLLKNQEMVHHAPQVAPVALVILAALEPLEGLEEHGSRRASPCA